MKVTIVTVVKNNKQFIKQCIESVLSQTYSSIEYVVIDGASTDGTLDIINEYKHRIHYLVSEADNGIYEAMNKGLQAATGEVIGFLNSDDFFTSANIIEQVVEEFVKHSADAVYGDVIYVQRSNVNHIRRVWVAGNYDQEKFNYGWMIPHLGLFFRKSLVDKFGLFRKEFNFSGDYELIIRIFKKNRLKVVYLPQFLTKLRMGGKSNRSLWNRLMANREDRKAWEMNNFKHSILVQLFKPLRKIPQFFPFLFAKRLK